MRTKINSSSDTNASISRYIKFSAASDRNKEPIYQVIKNLLIKTKTVIEIGSGTAQHAVYFAQHMPWLNWQTADRAGQHDAIMAMLLKHNEPSNIQPPLSLDVNTFEFDRYCYDAVFTANTAHIMSWLEVCKMLAGCSRLLTEGGQLIVYGPFSEGGVHTSESNHSFDLSLRQQNPRMGIRDFDDINNEAENVGLDLHSRHALPANNQILVWRKISR